MLNISHISPPPSCCTRRILNIFLNFFSTFFSGFFFSWTGRRRFACQLQLLLLLAKTEMRSHGAFIQGSWPNGPEKTTPSISHLCTLGSTLFYYYVFWVWVSYSHLHINLFAFVRAVLSSFPAFPTFPLFPFSWHFIAYFWESVASQTNFIPSPPCQFICPHLMSYLCFIGAVLTVFAYIADCFEFLENHSTVTPGLQN